MLTRVLSLLPFLALAGAVPATAQTTITGPASATNYRSGDLLLSFYGASAANDTIFDLGSLASFEDLTGGRTYVVANFNAPSVVTANTGAFGANVYWNVAGGNAETGELTLTAASGSLRSSINYTTLANTIDNIGFEVAGNAAAGTTYAVLNDKPVYNQVGVNASHEWSGGPSNATDSVTTGTMSLTLWDLDSGKNNTGAAVDLGTFTLNTADDQLTFTAAGSSTPPPASGSARLINLSTRAQVGTGANLLIPGFVVAGGGTETLLIRADGPALTAYGVPGVLAAPSLTVFDSHGNQVAANLGWGTAADPAMLAGTAATVGAFPLASGSADCAVLVSVPPGAYTVQVAGVGGTTGVALAEVYEVGTTGTRLVNVSTRAQVGTGANVLIPGFVISGSGPESLLVRADGPSLATFGVTGFLAQPSLEVLNSSGTAVAANTVWGTAADPSALVAAAAAAGAFPFAAGSTDSAATASLPAGAYTMQASGVDGSTGIALAEVYAVAADE